MGDLVRITDHPKARWAIIDERKRHFVSRRQTRAEAEAYFVDHVLGAYDNAWLIQEGDVDPELYKDTEQTLIGSL